MIPCRARVYARVFQRSQKQDYYWRRRGWGDESGADLVGVGGVALDQHQQFPEHGVEPWLQAGEGGSCGGARRGWECEVRLRVRCVCLSSAAEKRRHWAAVRGEEARLCNGSQPCGAETFLIVSACYREMFFVVFFSCPSLHTVAFYPVI